MPVSTAQKIASSATRDTAGEEVRGGRGGAPARGDEKASTTDRGNRDEDTAQGSELSNFRQRSRSVSQCGTQQGAGDSANLRKRSHSSASPSYRSGGDFARRRQLAILGELGDISALSVELAVADKKSAGQKILCSAIPRQDARGRSKSICVGASVSDRGLTRHGSRGAGGERSRRSLTQVEPACNSSSDESQVETAGDNDGCWPHHSREHFDFFGKQSVIRPHRQLRSVPSIVELFKLKPVSSSEALAAAARCRRSSVRAPQSPGVHRDDVGSEAPQSPFGVPGSEGGDDDVRFGSDDERLAKPGLPLDGENAAAWQSRTSTHHEGPRQIDSPHRHHRRRDSNESTPSPIQPWAGTSPPYRDCSPCRDDRATSSSLGASALLALFEEERKAGETAADDDATTADENNRHHSLRSARAKEKLVLGQRFGERFGTTGVRMSSGSRSEVDYRVHRRQENDVPDLDALENGDSHTAVARSETAKTVSQTETPTSKHDDTATPLRGSGGLPHHRTRSCRSLSFSYVDSVDVDPLRARPSARLCNEAKHCADQKRGVTTSYKREEQYKHFHKIALFLVVLGVLIGMVSHGIDIAIIRLYESGARLVEEGGAAFGHSPPVRFFLFWIFAVTLVGLAALITSYFSPSMEGSGIPAMKYMMDTDDVANKLKSFTIVALIVKALGLTLAAGGGLNIGREGPYTHMAGMVSYLLMRHLPFFHDILDNETVLRQVLTASVATGVSSTFAATIGGVLFSIEVTTLYYDVGNYFKAFVAAISGTVAVSLVRTIEGSPDYIESTFSTDVFEPWQYAVFALMGVLCGFLGPVYVNFRLHMLKLARRWSKHSIRSERSRRWEYVRAATMVACLVSTMTAVLSYFPGEFTRTQPLVTFKQLLSEGSLPDSYAAGPLGNIFLSLPVSILITFTTAALGTSVSVPSGDFIQTLVIGALVGRLIGETMNAHLGDSAGVVPSTFALVGAAGLSCGATQTISAAVVIMEVTGSFELNKPVLLAAVVAFGFSRRFGLNIYDSVMALNGLESLYGLDMRRSEEMTAKDIMETHMNVVPCHTTVGELLTLLRGAEGGKGMFESYPVVAGLDGMAFVGTISRKDLVYIVLTGGSFICTDVEYFEYVIQQLPKKDVAGSWDRICAHNMELVERLSKEVKYAVLQQATNSVNTVRALKLFGDKLGYFASDMSIMRSATRSIGKGTNGHKNKHPPRDPRDRDTTRGRTDLSMLFTQPTPEEDPIEDHRDRRPVDLILIASRASRDVQIDRSVWKAHESMPLNNVYLLFANLRCIRLFVIAGDRLTGVISRSILYNAMSNREASHDVTGSSSSRYKLEQYRPQPWAVSSRRKRKRWYDIFLGRGVRPPTAGL